MSQRIIRVTALTEPTQRVQSNFWEWALYQQESLASVCQKQRNTQKRETAVSPPASENGPKEAMNKTQKKDVKKHGKSRKAKLLHLHMQMLEQFHPNTVSLPKLWASQTLSSITSSSASLGGLLTWVNKLSAITFQLLHVAMLPLLPEDSAYRGIPWWGHQSLHQLSMACNCSWLSCTSQLHDKLMSKLKLLQQKKQFFIQCVSHPVLFPCCKYSIALAQVTLLA